MSLIALAGKIGLPILSQILSRRLGTGPQLTEDVLRAVAARAGVPVGDLDALAESDPTIIGDALREVERQSPELVALYATGLEKQFALLAAEQEEGGWRSGWRPAGMYLIGFLWLWNVVVLHVCNAIWKIALPPMDFGVLIQISGLYMGLYMGGHTVKDLAEKWKAKA